MIHLKTCPICDCHELHPLLSTVNRYDENFASHRNAEINHILKNVLDIDEVQISALQCQECKHLFLSPTFSQQEIERLYSTQSAEQMHVFYQKAEQHSGRSYQEETCSVSGNRSEELSFRQQFIRDVVLNFRKKDIGKLLDIGGANGENILLFKQAQKYVYDLDLRPENLAPEVEGTSSIAEVQQLAPFDLLISTHTLEHIVSPKAMISDYTAFIREGSLFYIEVPSEYLSILMKHYLSRFRETRVDIHWHINFFSPSSLKRLMEQCGFRPLYVKTHLMPYNDLSMRVIVGVFEYTGAPQSFSPRFNPVWWQEFANDFLQTLYLKGHRKLLGTAPKPKPFSI